MKFRLSLIALTMVAAVGTVWAQGLGDAKAATQEAAKKADVVASDDSIIAAQAPSYPLNTCVVSGEPLEEATSFVVEGRLLRTCCERCAKKVMAEPAAYVAKVDAAVVRAQKASYPMSKCVVGGNDLGDDAIDYVHGTRLVRFCCEKCVDGFKKDSAKYMAELDKALIAAQLASYPLATCPVSGEELGGEGMQTLDMLHGTRLVRLCCKSCVRGFQKEPAKYVAMLDAAVAARTEKK